LNGTNVSTLGEHAVQQTGSGCCIATEEELVLAVKSQPL